MRLLFLLFALVACFDFGFTASVPVPDAGSSDVALPMPCVPAYQYDFPVVDAATSPLPVDDPYDAGSCAPLVVIDGDSIAQGYYASPISRGYGSIAWEYATSGPCPSFVNNARSGDTVLEVDAVSKKITDPLFNACRPHNIVVYYEWANSYLAGETAQEVLSDVQAYVTHRRAVGWEIVTILPLPFFNPRDARADVTATIESDRQWMLTQIRANPTAYGDVLVDPTADPFVGVANAFANPAWYEHSTHPTSFGHARLAAYVTPVLRALLQ